jgi:hypothetical protein
MSIQRSRYTHIYILQKAPHMQYIKGRSTPSEAPFDLTVLATTVPVLLMSVLRGLGDYD